MELLEARTIKNITELNNHHYNKKLKGLAKALRNGGLKSEACMWKYALSRRQMLGYQFRTQRPIDQYIVDFVCLPLKLIIEIDGLTHEDFRVAKKDSIRDRHLNNLGFTTLRFSSFEVLNEIIEASIEIEKWIIEHAKIPPPDQLKRSMFNRDICSSENRLSLRDSLSRRSPRPSFLNTFGICSLTPASEGNNMIQL